jgi:predicted nucleic-acid-binding protein
MLGLDTNVIVRFLLRDDRRQAAAAQAAIEDEVAKGEPAVVSLVTLAETEWVLRSSARLSKLEVLSIFRRLLETKELLFENEESVEEAIFSYEHSKADFAECLMLAQYRRIGCSAMLTFDARAAKLPGAELVQG